MSTVASEVAPAPARAASRTRTVFMTGFWFVANFLVTFAQQLAIVPLFLKYWKAPMYGDWIELTSITVWFSMADAGMQSYVANRLTMHHARHEWDKFRADLASATLMYTVVLSTAAGLLLTLAFAMPIAEHFRAQGRPLADSAVLIFVLMGAYILMMILQGFIGALYRALGHANRSPRISFFHRLFILINTMLVLVLGGTPRHLAYLYISQAVLVTIYVAWDTHRIDPRATPTLRGADWKMALGFLTPSLMFFILDTGKNLTGQGMTILVSEKLGAIAVVAFTTTRTLANALRQVASILNNTVWPELTRINARGETERLALGHGLVVKWTTMLSIIPAAILFFCGAEVYTAWTRGRSVADESLLRYFLLDVVLGTPAVASMMVLQASNEVRMIAGLQIVAGVANIIGCFLLIHFFGVAGAAAAPIPATILLFGTFVPMRVQEHLKQPASQYWRDIYFPLGVIFAAALGVCWLVHREIPHGLTGVAALSVAAVVSVLGLAALMLFNAQERGFIKEMAGKVMGRLSRA